MPSYPEAYDSLPAPVDGVTEVLAAHVVALANGVDHTQHAVGLEDDTPSPSGSIYARIANLEDAAGGIFKQAAAPGSPTTDDLWIDTDDTDRPLYDFRSAAWELIGANALQVRGLDIYTTAPEDGQVLTWVEDNDRLEWVDAPGGLSNPMTTAGDLLYSTNGSGTPGRLAIGAVGQFLSVAAGPTLEWATPAYIPAPAGPNQGDVLYYNGTAWTRLGPGTTGQFLKTLGASSNPAWADLPSSPPGSAIEAPVGSAEGDLLVFDGVDWVPLVPGTSGLFLKSNGAAALPTWAAPAGGMSNPMTTAGDLIYSTNGSGTPGRVGIGTNGYVLTAVAGAPAWAANPAGFADPMTTRGDLIYRASGGTGRLALGAANTVITSDGTDAAWAVPPAYTQVEKNTGGGLTARRRLNLIEGTNVTLTVADNSGTGATDVTIAATGGGGGSGDIEDGGNATGADVVIGTTDANELWLRAGTGTNAQALVAYLDQDARMGLGGTQSPLAHLDIMSAVYAAMAFQHSSGGYRHFLDTTHNDVTQASNKVRLWMHTAGGGANASTAPNTGNTLAAVFTSTGLGVAGVTDPSTGLEFPGAVGAKINLYSGAFYGFGVQSNTLQAIVNGSGDRFAVGYGTSGSYTEVARFQGDRNVGFGGSSFGSGVGVLFMADGTAPSGTPTGGGIIYVSGGALLYKGSSGTVTPIAPA